VTWRRPAWLAVALGAEVAVVAAVFGAVSGVSYWTGLYWALTTATTVGYGDVAPHGGAARLVAVVVMLTAIPLLGAVFSAVTSLHVRTHVHKVLREHEEAKASAQDHSQA
jgi:Ion channel